MSFPPPLTSAGEAPGKGGPSLQAGAGAADGRSGGPAGGREQASATAIARTLERHPRPLGGDPIRRHRATVSLSSLVLNNDGPSQLAPQRKPGWLRAKVPGGAAYQELRDNIDANRLHTVCQEAACPNMGECWARGVATIMILGDTCTRSCGFCNVKSGVPIEVDRDEARRAAESIAAMKLRHVVVTSVNRDELRDGGASVWAEMIIRSRDLSPQTSVEVLIPDFMGRWEALQLVIDARPHIIAHNIETVKRMYPAVRPSARYDRSMEMLLRCKQQGVVAKTSIMVGIGERPDEVLEFMDELRELTTVRDGEHRGAFTDILTIGQYLQPTRNHLPVHRFVHPDEFAMYEREGLARGFKVVQSGPMVRSSYLADAQADKLTTIESERAKLRRVEEMIGRG